MKKAHLKGLVVAVTISVAGSAFAGFWSSPILIATMHTADDGYIVFPSATTPINNPAHCTDTSQAWGYPSSTDVEKDLMNRTLLSAFMANRKVKLNIASTVCTPVQSDGVTTYPYYLHAEVDSSF